MHLAHYPCAAPRRVASHLPFLPMDSPSAPPALLPGLRALPYGSSRRSLCPHSNQRLQRLPSPGASRRLVAAAAVDRLAPRRPEAGRLRWKYLLACRGPYDSGNGLAEPPPPPPSGESVDVWRPALRRWDVPWQWPTVSLTMVACALSSLLAGKVEQLVLEYLGYQAGEANIDEKAGTDSLVLLLPLIGSSNISTACLLGITGVLAPILEETVFRGFLMVSLTMWFSTPVSVLITAVVFAFAHLTPGEFPQLFVLAAGI